MGAPSDPADRRPGAPDLRRAAAPLVVALVVLLPFAPGLLAGSSFFFRDLSRHFFPRSLFAAEGLRAGELRFWNPYIHEGEALLPPPVGYLPDLLQVLVHDQNGLTWLLVLHVVLGALAAYALARELELPPVAAACCAQVYALGGFFLSCVNLHMHLKAAAWAPLVVLALMRAAEGGLRARVGAAVLTAVGISTSGIEIMALAIGFGIALSLRRDDFARRLLNLGLSLGLGAALAAPVVLPWQQQLGAGARSHGFGAAASLALSVVPRALPQTVIAGFLGEPPTSLKGFWGHRFITGFPYFLSLYLGAAVLAVAILGARREPWVRRTLAMAALGLAIALGPVTRLDLVLEALPFLQAFRFPSKAFFLVHLAAALLVGRGVAALVAEGRPAFRRLAIVAAVLAVPLVLAPLAPDLLREPMLAFGRGFFPEARTDAWRLEALHQLTASAAAGGSFALAASLVAALAAAGRVGTTFGAIGVAALIAADLIRAGVGVNPMVSAAFYRPSPSSRALAARVAEAGGRLFVCNPENSPRLIYVLRMGGRDDDVRTVAVLQETLAPSHNMALGVLSAYSRDASGIVRPSLLLTPEEESCADVPGVIDRLRRAGVSHVVALDPIAAPGLTLEGASAPESIAPLNVLLYRLDDPLPLRAVAGRVVPAASAADAEAMAASRGFQDAGGAAVEGAADAVEGASGRVLSAEESPERLRFEVEADRATMLIVRDAWAPGWEARVDGVPVPVRRADGRHRAVAIPAGHSEVVLSYRPPGLTAGIAVGLAGLAVAAALMVAGGRRPGAPPGPGAAPTEDPR